MARRLVAGLVLGAAVGLALAIRLALFGAGCAHMPVTDDECLTVLQAKQIARGELPLLLMAQPYMFPLEAYMMAPLVDHLPRTPAGARAMAFGLGLVSLLLGWLVLRRWGRLADTWPGLVLLLFGSPYLLMMQYGIALPGYPSLIFLSSVLIWLACTDPEAAWKARGRAVLIGLLGGLACSVTMLALPVLIMAATMVGWHRNGRTARWTFPLACAGTIVGLIPHMLARASLRDPSGDILRLDSWRDALDGLVSPTLEVTLPAVLGMGCPVVPGGPTRVASVPALDLAFGVLGLVFLAAVTLRALATGWQRWREERWPSLDAGLVLAGTAWICLIMFLFSSRSSVHAYRYLTLMAWAWPFLAGYLYYHSGRVGRRVAAVLTILLVVANLQNGWGLLQRWNAPSFTAQLKAHDLTPVVRYLDERGIRYAYSVYADAYRLTFATDERITCAQLYNERFPCWPLPYKTEVDQVTNVAYVLSSDSGFTSEIFENDMASAKVTCRAQVCGAYKVYTDFVSSLGDEKSVRVSTADASHSPEDAAFRINTPDVFWRTEGFTQQTGMWVSVEWEESQQIGRLLVNHGAFVQDHPHTVNVYYRLGEGWTRWLDPIPCLSTPFTFRNGHPVYGGAVTRVDLPSAVTTRGIKLEIVEPRLGRAWTICGVSFVP